jgi:hypothetical protein
MPHQLLLHDVEQFARVRSVPAEAISDNVLVAIRTLSEKEVLEPAIRRILHDPTETPHGPTEIADILTSRITVAGQPRTAAFLLKGRSLQRVSSREIAHQFVRLRQIPDLQLSILMAVGHIQDDARRDFVQSALDAGADYLIVDARDIARLLIAYEVICAQDGSVFDESGMCAEGHERDPGVPITIRVQENPRYEVVKLQDVSHAGARRYSAFIIVDKHYSRDSLREIIRAATDEIRLNTYYRSQLVEEHWRETPAHVVWLFLGYDPEDVRRTNWICRTEWIDPLLDPSFRPVSLHGNEQLGEIEIDWNERYTELKQFYSGLSASKGELLGRLRPILRQMLAWGDEISERFHQYRSGILSDAAFTAELERLWPKITELYQKSGDLPMPPDDLKDYDQVCHSIFAYVDNMVLPFSDLGRGRWNKEQRDALMDLAIRNFKRDVARLQFEEEKIH